MRISAIKLENFRSYRNQTFEFPPLRDDKNIILIGGLNGYGKTSILEAIYLGLYGPEAVKYLGRAGLRIDGRHYQNFIARVFHGNADNDCPMSITIEFLYDDNSGYNVNRTWYFDKNREFGEEELKIYSVLNGVKSNPIDDEFLSEILGNHFVPANIAQFFFFDGEEIKQLARKDKMETVKTAIDSFLGVVVLKELQNRLSEYQNTRRRGITQTDEENLKNLFERKTKIESTISDLTNRENEYVYLQDQADTEWNSLHDRMLTLGGIDGNLRNVKELAEKINEAKGVLHKAQQELTGMVCNKLALNLISPKLISKFLVECDGEIATRAWKNECQMLKPQREKFLNNFSDFGDYAPPLLAAQIEKLKEKITSAWESMFYPMPENCVENPVHEYMPDDQIRKIKDIHNNIGIGRQEIEHKLDDIKTKKRHLAGWEKQMAKLEGYDNTGDLVLKLKKEFEEMTRKRDEILRTLNSIQNELTAERRNLDNISAEYNREHQRYLANAPVAEMVSKAEHIKQFIDKLITNLYPLKKQILQAEITKVFKQLSHKNSVHKITLDDNATAHLLNKDGERVDLDQSAGESQLFATALIAALANISRDGAPLVVDTPLGRLDSHHRDNILNLWTHDSSRQVILLSQDEEITKERFFKIKNHILKSYILEHKDMGHGIGQTTAREGYFGG